MMYGWSPAARAGAPWANAPKARQNPSNSVFMILPETTESDRFRGSVSTGRSAQLPAALHHHFAGQVDNLRLRQQAEAFLPHVHNIAMRSGIEDNHFISQQVRIHQNLHAVETAERRHGAEFAIGKEPLQFGLGCQARRMAAQRVAHLLKVHYLTGGHYQ